MRGETFKVVSYVDPTIAAQMTPDESLAYVKTRDFKLVEPLIKPDTTVFHCREVPHKFMASQVLAVEIDSIRYLRAFACGVTMVENLVQADGTTISKWSPTAAAGEQMSEKEVFARFSAGEIAEIGEVIFANSFLHRKIVPTFLLQSSLQGQWARQTFRLADASPNSAAPSSEKQSAASGQPQGETEKP